MYPSCDSNRAVSYSKPLLPRHVLLNPLNRLAVIQTPLLGEGTILRRSAVTDTSAKAPIVDFFCPGSGGFGRDQIRVPKDLI